jgi:hypothetical protein
MQVAADTDAPQTHQKMIVYVLECTEGKYYVGRCNEGRLQARLEQHNGLMNEGAEWTRQCVNTTAICLHFNFMYVSLSSVLLHRVFSTSSLHAPICYVGYMAAWPALPKLHDFFLFPTSINE